MAKFNLGDVLAQKGDVSGLDTFRRDQIEYIDIDRIDEDPNNFYTLDGIDELAANIELCGLQQPLRVRAGDGDRVVILSGHRRRAAVRKLVDEGRADLREVPVIRERSNDSTALQELKLIYANSDTRRMSSADISKQAERIEELLYQLKEEGYEFPGRMRDHVAEACKVSASKLARLKVIREKLGDRWMPHFESGKLSEAAAYALAQLPKSWQGLILEGKIPKDVNQYWWLSEGCVKNIAEHFERIAALKCKQCGGGECSNSLEMMLKCASLDQYWGAPCGKQCCLDCSELASCKSACTLPQVDKLKKKLLQERKDQRAQEKAAEEERNHPTVERLADLWERFGVARSASGKTAHEIAVAAGIPYCQVLSDEGKVSRLECREQRPSPTEYLPYGYNFGLSDLDRIVKIADALGCSIDYLFCRAPVSTVATADSAPTWQTGKPPRDGNYYCKFDCEGVTLHQVAWWSVELECWSFKRTGATLDAIVVGWYPLPTEEG